MGATASEKATPHHAPGSLPCQPRRCRACPRGRPPPLHRPPSHLLCPLCHLSCPTCETEFEEVKGQSCVTKPVTECNDVEVPSHKIVTEDVCQNVTTAECTHSTYSTGVYYGKREAEADPQLLVGAVPVVTPYHTCVNKVTEVCYPVQKVEPTTITEKSCLLKGEVECTEVVVATIPKVTCPHEEHTKPADDAAAVETE